MDEPRGCQDCTGHQNGKFPCPEEYRSYQGENANRLDKPLKKVTYPLSYNFCVA